MLGNMHYRFEPVAVNERFVRVGKWGEYRHAGGMNMCRKAGEHTMGDRKDRREVFRWFTGALTANMRPDGESGRLQQDWGWDNAGSDEGCDVV
jgi:hypothetical protein